MNKYKLIISDFDGTLTRHDHTLSPVVVSAVKKWIGLGNHFSIASGRQYAMIKREVDELGLKDPVIVRGGAEIVDSKTEKIIYSKVMNAEDVQIISQMLEPRGVKFVIEKEDILYGNTTMTTELPGVTYEKLADFQNTSAPKIVAFAENHEVEHVDAIMTEIQKKLPGVHIVKSFSPHWNAWDVTAADATKHLATLELMKILHIDRVQSVGVGDGYNDFPLLEACGLKVAMGNANEDLKAIADMVGPSYHEDGVAVLIEKLLGNET